MAAIANLDYDDYIYKTRAGYGFPFIRTIGNLVPLVREEGGEEEALLTRSSRRCSSGTEDTAQAVWGGRSGRNALRVDCWETFVWKIERTFGRRPYKNEIMVQREEQWKRVGLCELREAEKKKRRKRISRKRKKNGGKRGGVNNRFKANPSKV